MADKKTIWNEAGKAGLILGAVSILYLLYSQLTQGIGAGNKAVTFIMSALSVLVWGAKVAGCKVLMRLFVRKHDNSFGFGTLVAFLSSLVYSAFYMAFYLIICPGKLEGQMETLIPTLSASGGLDANTLSALQTMSENIVQIGFFSNLIYCFLFGLVLAAIFSAGKKNSNPFNGQPDNQ